VGGAIRGASLFRPHAPRDSLRPFPITIFWIHHCAVVVVGGGGIVQTESAEGARVADGSAAGDEPAGADFNPRNVPIIPGAA